MRDDDPVAKLMGQLRNAVAERIVRLNRSLEAEEQSVAARVEQRRQLAWQLQLLERLLTIYEEVQYYRDWARNRPEDVCPLVTEVTVNEKRASQSRFEVEKRVGFSLKGNCYSFAFEEHDFYMDGTTDYYARLTLAGSNGDVLFKERMSRPGGQYGGGKYRVIDIDAFVPGEWVLDFLELSEAITAQIMERDHRRRLSEIERQKQDFALSLPDSELHKLQAVLNKHGVPKEHRPTATGAHAMGGWFRRLFGRHHDDRSGAT